MDSQPIDKTESVSYIFSVLDDYNKKVENGETPDIDPYREHIYMKSNDGRYVQVSEDLQKFAIREWLAKRGLEPRNVTMEESISKSDDKCKMCKRDGKKRDRTLIDTTFQLILCLIIIFTILYTLSLVKKGILKF